MATPKQAPDTVEARAVEVNGLGISYTINLDEGRQLLYETKLDATSEQQHIDDLLDMMHAATERQLAKVKLPQAHAKLKIAHTQLRLQERLYAETEAMAMARWGASRKQGEFKPSEQVATSLANIQSSIARFRADIPILEWEIERLTAIIDRVPPPPEPQRLAEAAE